LRDTGYSIVLDTTSFASVQLSVRRLRCGSTNYGQFFLSYVARRLGTSLFLKAGLNAGQKKGGSAAQKVDI
jgi:hypothetical protein